MLPMIVSQNSREVRKFEVLTPSGGVYKFPRPSLWQRLLGLLYSHADTVVVSAIVIGMVYFAGALAEMIPTMAPECRAE